MLGPMPDVTRILDAAAAGDHSGFAGLDLDVPGEWDDPYRCFSRRHRPIDPLP